MRTCDGWKTSWHLTESIILVQLKDKELFLCHKCLASFAIEAKENNTSYSIDEPDDCCG